MERFSVKFSDTFFEDLIAIVQFIADKTGSKETARRFYENALHAIEVMRIIASKNTSFNNGEMYYE